MLRIDRFEHFLQPSGREAPPLCYPSATPSAQMQQCRCPSPGTPSPLGHAAAALGISRAFAYEAITRNEIPHVRVGRRILVPRASLERMLGQAGTTDA
jgi:excisionase family DNA binding protein